MPIRRVLSLSIVLPCFNEEGNVERVARTAVEVGRRLSRDLEVIVVDDGSRDRTAEIASRLKRTLPELRLVQNPRNLGYGGALRRGLLAASKRWVFYTDGDGQFDIAALESLLPHLGESQIVSGYRAPRRDGLRRSALGLGWTVLTNAVLGLGLRDVNSAFKIYPRALFDQIELTSLGALIDAEIFVKARALGFTIVEVPVPHFPRAVGQQSGGCARVMLQAVGELGRLTSALRMHRGRMTPPVPDVDALVGYDRTQLRPERLAS